MLTSFPFDYPLRDIKKRSIVCDDEPQWTKRTKRHDSPTPRFSPQSISTNPYRSTVQQQLQQHRSSPLVSSTVNTMANDTVGKESMDDVMMVDSLDSSSCYSERIDDIEKYLDDGGDSDMKKGESCMTKSDQPIDIYTLLERQHRPLTAMLVNGTLLPMERQQGGTKHCIPEFVLRSPKSTTCTKSNLNIMPMDQSLQAQQFILSNDSLMDID